MKTRTLFATIAVIALLVSGSTHADPIIGTSSGIFTNPQGGVGMVTTGVGTSTFTWGQVIQSPPSSLTFTGTPFNTTTETIFKVGTLDYYNGTTAGGTGANFVDLEIEMQFTSPAGVTENFAYTLELINTPNVGTPEENADIVKLPTTFVPKVFQVGGVDYTLQLLGFDNPSQGGFVLLDQFFVYEDARATADLMAIVTSDIPPVPEPASMILAGLGLSLTAAIRKRRTK